MIKLTLHLLVKDNINDKLKMDDSQNNTISKPEAWVTIMSNLTNNCNINDSSHILCNISTKSNTTFTTNDLHVYYNQNLLKEGLNILINYFSVELSDDVDMPDAVDEVETMIIT